LVACSDTFKSVLYVSTAATNVGEMITLASGGERQYEPVYWLVFYALCVGVHAYGGRSQWRVISALTVISVALLAVYLLGSAPFANLPVHAALEDDTNTPYEQWFHGGFYEFMHVLPRPCLFFVGIQNINLACREIREPKSEVPKAYMAGLGTGLLTSFSTVLVACSLLPGVTTLARRIHPLTTGYVIMFGITRAQAMVLSLPATIASGFGFMYFFGQQLRSMGQSRLLHPVFAKELPGRHTPVVALVAGSVLGYALCLVVYFKPSISIYLYNISMMGAFTTYLSIFLSFWKFRDNFPTITRDFASPLGKAGAAYGFAVFAFAFVAICGFQPTQIAVSTFSGMVIVATAYYYLVVVKRQVFSEEEKTVMFRAYLLQGGLRRESDGLCVLPLTCVRYCLDVL
jgi:amino acid transporter